MKKILGVIVIAGFAVMLSGSTASAFKFGKKAFEKQEEKTAAVPEETLAPTAAAVSASVMPAMDSESLKKLKAIEYQVAWVEKLKKQLDGETAQLHEMRSSLADANGLDIKKLEKNAYQVDPKSGKFAEKISDTH